MDQAREVAARWLTVAADVGWGIEGPENAAPVAELMEALAQGEPHRGTYLLDVVAARTLGTRPVDALYEAASLLVEAGAATGVRQDELLSAARGWLQIAVGRAPE